MDKRAIAIPILVFAAAFATSAFASTVAGSTYRFFGPTTYGGSTKCANQKAKVTNDSGSEAGIGRIASYYGSRCGNGLLSPAGYMGSQEWVIHDGNDLVCEFRDWYYNSSSGYAVDIYANWDPRAGCPAGDAYYAEKYRSVLAH